MSLSKFSGGCRFLFHTPLTLQNLGEFDFICSSFLASLCPSPTLSLAQSLCLPKWVIRRLLSLSITPFTL